VFSVTGRMLTTQRRCHVDRQVIPGISLSPSGCDSFRWGLRGQPHGSSPVVSILYVHWCEVQADEILQDVVYPSLPLPSPIPTSIEVIPGMCSNNRGGTVGSSWQSVVTLNNASHYRANGL